jgi:peptide subunit release factor 1 (eRF1)
VIDAAGVRRLLRIRAPDPRIVSVYVTVPLDPAQRRGLPAHLDEVLARGNSVSDDGDAWASARRSELPAIRQELSTHAHEWLGRSVAIFACAKLRLLETIPLRGHVRDRAVIGTRPYIRPLLAELQRCPCYAVAVVDRRHAWLFRVSGETITPEDHVQSQTVGSKKFGGWHGFQSYRNDQRARKLARQHYAAAGAALANLMGEGSCGLIVVGGHEPDTSDFAGGLPAALRERVAGTFVIDPHTMTPARVRQLTDDVVANWEDQREQRLASALAEQAGSMTAIGVDACLAAANQHAIQLLVVRDDEVRPGFSCERCGALAVSGGRCVGCGGPTRPVGDVIEELAVRVTEEGGSVHSVRGTEVLTDVAARRRFPAVA